MYNDKEIKVVFIGNSSIDHPNIECISDVEQGLARFTEDVQRQQASGLDSETVFREKFTEDGIPGALRTLQVALRFQDGSRVTYVFDVRDFATALLREPLANLTTYMWNKSFDLKVLRKADLSVKAAHDAMLDHSLLQLGSPGHHFHAPLAKVVLAKLKYDLGGKGTVQTSFDADTDLTSEQVLYAAIDADVTLCVGELINEEIIRDGLEIPQNLVQRSSYVFNLMEDHGIPINWDKYKQEVLKPVGESQTATLEEIADLTGGGIPEVEVVDGFGVETGSIVPDWDVNSVPALRSALNEYATDAVKAANKGSLIVPGTSIDRAFLQSVDHPLARALVQYSKNAKILTTYGDNLKKHLRTNEFGLQVLSARYNQAIAATGRLASHSINAQNLSPKMKKYIEAPEGYVFLYGDYSQAEIRGIADMAADQTLLEIARHTDIHAATAGVIFNVDMDKLKVENISKYQEARHQAKATNFGIPYGIGAEKLADDLTKALGRKVSVKEAQQLLDRYMGSYPDVAAWLNNRDTVVKNVVNSLPDPDWALTLKLYKLKEKYVTTSKQAKKALGTNPSSMEIVKYCNPREDVIADLTERNNGTTPEEADIEAEYQKLWEDYVWSTSFSTSIVLLDEVTPYEWFSYTPSGRRRRFQVSMDAKAPTKITGILFYAACQMATTHRPDGAEFVQKIMYENQKAKNLNGKVIPPPTKYNLPKGSSTKNKAFYATRRKAMRQWFPIFKGVKARPIRLELIEKAIQRWGWETTTRTILNRALSSQVMSLSNAHRNHPIQGVVADIVEQACIDLQDQGFLEVLRPFMTVHDSVVFLVKQEDAEEWGAKLKTLLENAQLKWSPLAPPKADVDIRTTLSDSDVIKEF